VHPAPGHNAPPGGPVGPARRALAAAAVALAVLAGCGAPAGNRAAAAPWLYVANTIESIGYTGHGAPAPSAARDAYGDARGVTKRTSATECRKRRAMTL
jgi:hypothetical protein